MRPFGVALKTREDRKFQSTHPMRDATVGTNKAFTKLATISIHASHAGCDWQGIFPLKESGKFQSTHPMRDATSGTDREQAAGRYFNPLIPCGMRLLESFYYANEYTISIHASHAGCDPVIWASTSGRQQFQSTHPMRDATWIPVSERLPEGISIHASHAGCDR